MENKKLKSVTPHILIILLVASIVGGRIENIIYRIKTRSYTYDIYEPAYTVEGAEGEQYATGSDDTYIAQSNLYGESFEIKAVGPITLDKASYTEYIYFQNNDNYIMIESYPEMTVDSEDALEESGLTIEIFDEGKNLVQEYKHIKNTATYRYYLKEDVKGKTYEVKASGPGFYGYYNIIWGLDQQED